MLLKKHYKGQFGTVFRNSAYSKNVFPRNAFIKNVFIEIRKSDSIKVFCNMSYTCKNIFISLKVLIFIT